MATEKVIASIIFMVLGILLFFNSKNIGKGASKFYQTICTAKNLNVIFKVVGILLIVLSVILILGLP